MKIINKLKKMTRQLNIKKLDYRLVFVLVILISTLYLNWYIFESISNKLLTTFLYLVFIFLIYFKKRLTDDKKIIYYWALFSFIFTIIFFKVTLQEGNIIFLSIAILFGVATYNHVLGEVVKIKKIPYLNVFFLILAVVTLDATNPILKPRVDISGVGPIDGGLVFNGEGYIARDYTFEITPPILPQKLLPNNCKIIRLGDKLWQPEYKQDIYGINISYFPENGNTNFCLYGESNVKSIVVLSIKLKRDLNYILNNRNYNLTNFFNVQNFSNLFRHPIVIINNENFPINFQGNFTFTINKKTTYKNNLNLFSDLTKDKSLLKCNLDYFYFNYNISQLHVTPLSGYKVGRDSINMTFPINFNINPLSFNEFNIIYSTDHCVAVG